MVVTVEDEGIVVIEEALQPGADTALGPVGVELDADIVHRGLRGGDAFHLAQHALAVALERAREQLPLVCDGGFVGVLRRGEHRHHDAEDGDGDDDADRDHDAQARAIPTRILPFLGGALASGSGQGKVP